MATTLFQTIGLSIKDHEFQQFTDAIVKHINDRYRVETDFAEKILDYPVYVDFNNEGQGQLSICAVEVQDRIHHFEMLRESIILKWLIEDLLPNFNQKQRIAYRQAQEIRQEQKYVL